MAITLSMKGGDSRTIDLQVEEVMNILEVDQLNSQWSAGNYSQIFRSLEVFH